MFRGLVVLFVLVATWLPTSAVGQDAAGSSGLDLPGALLRPADLEEVGLVGFGTGVGATGGADSLERFDRTFRGSDTGAVTVDPDGVQRSSSLYLVRGADLDLPSPDRVLTAISQFPDEASAAGAFEEAAQRRGAIADGSGADIEVADGRGMAFLVTGNDPLGAETYRQASVLAAVGDLVIEVAVELTSGTPLTSDLAEDLFMVKGARLDETVPNGESPGTRLLEITGTSVVPDLSRYLAYAGAVIPIAGESEDAWDDRAALYDAYGAVEVFQASVVAGNGDVVVGSFLSRHETESDARSYFQDIPELLGSNDDYVDVEVGNAIVPVGAAATLISYGVDGQDDVVVTELVFRSGHVVVELIVNATEPIERTEMTALARATEACLDGETCRPFAIPDDFGTSMP